MQQPLVCISAARCVVVCRIMCCYVYIASCLLVTVITCNTFNKQASLLLSNLSICWKIFLFTSLLDTYSILRLCLRVEVKYIAYIWPSSPIIFSSFDLNDTARFYGLKHCKKFVSWPKNTVRLTQVLKECAVLSATLKFRTWRFVNQILV